MAHGTLPDELLSLQVLSRDERDLVERHLDFHCDQVSRLRGAHLRPILATDLVWPMLKALALESVIDQTIDPDRLLARFLIQYEEFL